MEKVLTLNQKSQIVISKEIPKRLGLKPGDQLAAVVDGDKILLRPKPKSPSARLQDIVLEIGADNRIVGIKILDASKHLNLADLLPVKYQVSP